MYVFWCPTEVLLHNNIIYPFLKTFLRFNQVLHGVPPKNYTFLPRAAWEGVILLYTV